MISSDHYGGFGKVDGPGSVRPSPATRHWSVNTSTGDVQLELPDATGLAPGGPLFTVWNDGSGTVTYGEPSFTQSGIVAQVGMRSFATILSLPDNPSRFPVIDLRTQTETFVELNGPPPTGVLEVYLSPAAETKQVAYTPGEVTAGAAADGGTAIEVSLLDNSTPDGEWIFATRSIANFDVTPAARGIFAMGGSDAGGGELDATGYFETGLSVWVPKAAAPTPRAEASVAHVSIDPADRFYAVGGKTQASEDTANKHLLNQWAVMDAPPGGITIRSAASWGVGAVAYIHGGIQDGSRLISIAGGVSEVYTTQPASPVSLDGHTGGPLEDDGDLAYLSGNSGIGGEGLASVNVSTNVWDTTLPSRPSGTAGGVSSAAIPSNYGVGARIFVGGRYPGTSDQSDQTWEFRAAVNAGPVTWNTRPNAPRAIADAAAAGSSTSERAYLVGGEVDGAPSDGTYSYALGGIWRTEAEAPWSSNSAQGHGAAGGIQA